MQSELKESRWGHLWMLCIKRCQDLYFFHGGLVWRGSDFCTLLVLRFDRVLVHTQSCLIVCSNTVPHLFVFSLREVLVVHDVWKQIHRVGRSRADLLACLKVWWKDLWMNAYLNQKFTQPHVVPNLYYFLYTAKHKITILKKVSVVQCCIDKQKLLQHSSIIKISKLIRTYLMFSI